MKGGSTFRGQDKWEQSLPGKNEKQWPWVHSYLLPVPTTLHVNLSYTDMTLAPPTICLLKVFQWLPVTQDSTKSQRPTHPHKSGPLLPLKHHLLPPSALQPLWPSFIPGPARLLPSSGPWLYLRTFSFILLPSYPLYIIYNSVVTPQDHFILLYLMTLYTL